MITAIIASLLVLFVVIATFAMLLVGMQGLLAQRMPRFAARARAAALLLNGEMEEFEQALPAARGPRRAERPAIVARLTALLHRAAPEGQPSH